MSGAEFLVVPSPALPWLATHPELERHLEARTPSWPASVGSPQSTRCPDSKVKFPPEPPVGVVTGELRARMRGAELGEGHDPGYRWSGLRRQCPGARAACPWRARARCRHALVWQSVPATRAARSHPGRSALSRSVVAGRGRRHHPPGRALERPDRRFRPRAQQRKQRLRHAATGRAGRQRRRERDDKPSCAISSPRRARSTTRRPPPTKRTSRS